MVLPPRFLPCTPTGIFTLFLRPPLEYLAGIINRSPNQTSDFLIPSPTYPSLSSPSQEMAALSFLAAQTTKLGDHL